MYVLNQLNDPVMSIIQWSSHYSLFYVNSFYRTGKSSHSRDCQMPCVHITAQQSSLHQHCFRCLWERLSVQIYQAKKILSLILIFKQLLYVVISANPLSVQSFTTFIWRTFCCISRQTGSLSHSTGSLARFDNALSLRYSLSSRLL